MFVNKTILTLLVCLITGQYQALAQCDFEHNFSLSNSLQFCNKYSFTLNSSSGYQAVYNQWTVDGVAVTGAAMTTLELNNLSPGSHTICANVMGGAIGEPDNQCCGNRCTNIVVPEYATDPSAIVIDTTVNYCPLKYPSGPWVNPNDLCSGNFYVYMRDNTQIGTTADGPISYLLNSTSIVRCYELTSSGVKCLKKTYRFTIKAMSANTTAVPAVTLCATDTVYYTPCSGPYTAYELRSASGTIISNGTLPQGAPGLPLTAGNYSVICYNYNNCSSVRTDIYVMPPEESSCVDTIMKCTELTAVNPSIISHCDKCNNIIAKATKKGPWKPVSYDLKLKMNTVTRTYIDEANCRRCTMTFRIMNQYKPEVNISVMPIPGTANCKRLYESDLDPCLKGRRLKMFPEGSPDLVQNVTAEAGIVLCCETINGAPNPVYYLYTEDDPCCYMRIRLVCR